MGKDLGYRTAAVAIDNSGINPYGNGFWVGKITPQNWSLGANEFEAHHFVVLGPSGSHLQLWIDQEIYSTTYRGDINEWDPQQPMPLRGGQTLYIYWSGGGTSFPPGITTPIFNARIRERSPI